MLLARFLKTKKGIKSVRKDKFLKIAENSHLKVDLSTSSMFLNFLGRRVAIFSFLFYYLI